jgi:DNA-binding IclR family transcriptional regulator
MAELEQVRAQKFAVDDEELTRGMRCVAAPVMGDDTAIGAIGVSGPVSRLEDSRMSDELATEVRRVANVIEINSIFSE